MNKFIPLPENVQIVHLTGTTIDVQNDNAFS